MASIYEALAGMLRKLVRIGCMLQMCVLDHDIAREIMKE